MGWWDPGIMGGDTPWDFAGIIRDKLVNGKFIDLLAIGEFDEYAEDAEEWGRMHMPDDWTEGEQAILANAFNDFGIDNLLKDAKNGGVIDPKDDKDQYRSNDNNVGRQVIGMLAISCGAKLSAEAKKIIKKACDDDEWAKEDERRKKVVDLLKQAIEDYNGTPNQIQQTSLFEKMAEALG